MRARVLILFVLAPFAVTPSCRKEDEVVAPDSPLASEQKLLERQVASLKLALEDARRGQLFPAGDLAIGLNESAVQATVMQALPLQKPVGDDFMARIDRATVSFRSMQGAVTLEGRVWAIAEPNTFADLILLGGIGDVTVDPESGILKAEIVLDGWDVKRAAAVGTEAEWLKRLVRLMAADGVSGLRDLVPDLRIPVGIEKSIDLPGADGHPVSIPSGRLPLDARVSRVLPLSGVLWAMVRIRTTGWEPAKPQERARR